MSRTTLTAADQLNCFSGRHDIITNITFQKILMVAAAAVVVVVEIVVVVIIVKEVVVVEKVVEVVVVVVELVIIVLEVALRPPDLRATGGLERQRSDVCRFCAFEGGQFSSHKALERLNTAASSTDVEVLLNASRSEKLLMETYGVHLPDTQPDPVQSGQSADDQVDPIALQILGKYHPVINETHVPIRVAGDGNCLFRAVSLALYGTEEFHDTIRLLSAIEMIENRPHYDYEH
ncbi:hypothetical protein ElyMa_006630500 [Elysia marginata]|uniref:OTU domain-containing protein n=1 Tax=Elysia marginata TaxID=1093978 RepID=A0AAV4ILH0_9GAST|nr:hypothetical protein ElyMa_006630500 [Elysia marginata]